MRDVFHATAELQRVCAQHGWKFCFIGGLALQRWGDVTKDADLTLLTGFGGEEEFVSELLRHFRARIDGAAKFALEHVLKSFAGRGQDWVDMENIVVRQGTNLDWRYII